MQIYTSDRTSPRSFPWLWFVRLAAIVLSIIVLGITANDSSFFNSYGCNVPAKLAFNLAVAVVSLVILAYFMLSTGPVPALRIVPWFIWLQLGFDIVLFVLWLAAGSTSNISCDDLCSACADPGYGEIDYDTQSCSCFFYKRDTSPAPKGILEKRRGGTRTTGTVASKQAFDALLTVIFAAILACDVFWLVKHHMSGNTTSTNGITSSTNPIKQAEDGAGTGGVTTTAYPAQSEPAYGGHNVPMQTFPAHTEQSRPEMYPQQQQQQQQQQQFTQPTYPQTHHENHNSPMQSTSPPPQSEYSHGAMPPQQSAYPPPRSEAQEMQVPPHGGMPQ